jgi:DNA repair protein RadC
MKLQQSLGKRLKLTDQELLKELLLILGVKGNVKGIAQAAVEEFGNISGVLRQSPSDLKKIEGLNLTTITRLKTIYSLFREIIKPNAYPAKETHTFEDLSYFMLTAPKFDGDSLRLLFLDEDHSILKDFIYKKGFGNHVTVYFREMAKEILSAGISNVVFIHHKIGPSSLPSPRDKEKFTEINSGLKKLDIKLVDYLIVTHDTLFSFNSNEVYPENNKRTNKHATLNTL